MRTWIIAAFVVLAIATPVLAQPAPTADQRKAALQLFDDGKKAAEAGKFEDACPKFEESLKLDPGVGTLYQLADCYEHLGRTASAWLGFRDVATQAQAQGRADREKEARRRVGLLEPKIMRLKIVIPAASAVNGLVVKRDSEVVPQVLWGTAVPLDPGKHTITASAPGKDQLDSSVTLDKPGDTLTFELPALKDSHADVVVPPSGPLVPPQPTATAEPVVPPPPPGDTGGRSWQKPLGFVAIGVGAIGLGVGTAVGFMAKSAKDSSNEDGHCVGNACDAVGTPLRNDAVTKGNIATVVFIGGAVFAAGGVVLLLTAPSASKPSTGLRVGPASAAIEGTW